MPNNDRITFVQEFATYAKDFRENPKPVAAVSVSRCVLMEMNNRNPDTNERTIFSLTHFIVDQLVLPETDIIQRNLEVVVNQFVEKGGDLQSAQIRLYGGFERGDEMRDNLKQCLSNILPKESLVSEPKGHAVVHEDETLDYVFKASGITFRKSDMRYQAEDYKDTYSNDLKHQGSPDQKKIQELQAFLDSEHEKFAMANGATQGDARMRYLIDQFGADGMSQIKYGNLPMEDKQELERILRVSVVNERGSFPKEWIPTSIRQVPEQKRQDDPRSSPKPASNKPDQLQPKVPSQVVDTP